MKGKLLPAVLAAAISPSVFGGYAISYFPAQPDISAPAEQAVDVETTATVSTSAFTVTDHTGTTTSSGDINFESTKWRITAEPDASVHYYGGVSGDFSSRTPYSYTPEEFFLHDVPAGLDLQFDNTSVAQIRILNTGKLELLSEGGEVVASATARPTNLSSMYPSEALITVKEYTNAISVIWSFDFDSVDSTQLEAVIFNDAVIALRASPKSLSNDIYSLANGSLGVSIGEDSVTDTLPNWKTYLTGLDPEAFAPIAIDPTEFGLQFFRNSSGDLIHTPISERDISTYETPEFVEHDFAAITGEVSLTPGTLYQAYAQHFASSDWNSDYKARSSVSAPVTFTTELNSAYTLDLPSTEGIEVGVPADLTFTLNSTGEHGGAPKIEVVLPFNAIDNLNGSLADFFDADTENAEADCGVSIISGDTILSCTTLMDAGDSDTVDVTATFYAAGSYDVEYRVCETKLDGCDDVAYQTLAVEIEAEAQVDPATGGSGSSSSGGGSSLWLTLLALPLLRLRRKA